MKQPTNTRLSESLENYLEAIYQIVTEKHAAKARDIAKRLGVRSSSVTGALQNLAARGLVNYAPYDLITLTETGAKEAEKIVRSHKILRAFLTKVLAIPYEVADEAACRMEHAIPGEIIDRLTEFVTHVENCPQYDLKWTDTSGFKCEHGQNLQECEACLIESLQRVREQIAAG